jgi:lysozyme family protein
MQVYPLFTIERPLILSSFDWCHCLDDGDSIYTNGLGVPRGNPNFPSPFAVDARSKILFFDLPLGYKGQFMNCPYLFFVATIE